MVAARRKSNATESVVALAALEDLPIVGKAIAGPARWRTAFRPFLGLHCTEEF
jgi:hypothetical protein